ncbi:transmembrane protein, putative [Medicago truncatula]|uniref:Transmembrane protein, putative n=1 Tax=Medicago truncatula TaxID=3880 RepID=G7J2Z1_MEDTR|nr:transmembrane protein, putative [Medicago truncatula]
MVPESKFRGPHLIVIALCLSLILFARRTSRRRCHMLCHLPHDQSSHTCTLKVVAVTFSHCCHRSAITGKGRNHL